MIFSVLCRCDVKAAIESIPEADPDKYRDASAMLYLMCNSLPVIHISYSDIISSQLYQRRSTGARSVTFCSHEFRDIRSVRFTPDGTVLVSICQRISKNNRFIEHFVTLEGRLDSGSLTDFVYLMSVYLKGTFGLTLDETLLSQSAFKDLSSRSVPLWGYVTRDTWAFRLNMRFVSVGFPDRFFGPHGFRSGFLLTTIVMTRSSGGDVERALDLSSVVALWSRRSTVQLGYLRKGHDQLIVGTRILLEIL